MNHKLIEVWLPQEELIFCSCCDHNSAFVKVYYRIETDEHPLSFQKYLVCCVDKMGTVVDWEDQPQMKKRPNIKKINTEMDKINKRKPTRAQIEELGKVIKKD